MVPCGDLDLWPISRSNLLPGRGQQFFEFLPVEFDLALCVSSAECFYLNLVVNQQASIVFLWQLLFKNRCLWNTNAPFPNISRIGLTFDLLTWISIVIIYSSWTIYLPSVKLLGQSILELLVAQDVGVQDDLWPTDLNINSLGIIYSSMTFYLPSLKLLGQRILVISCTVCGRPRWTFDLDLWPTALNIIRDHLLIKDYLPTKFEASVAKSSCVISCTRLREIDIRMDMCKAICPSFFEGVYNQHQLIYVERVWSLLTSIEMDSIWEWLYQSSC